MFGDILPDLNVVFDSQELEDTLQHREYETNNDENNVVFKEYLFELVHGVVIVELSCQGNGLLR